VLEKHFEAVSESGGAMKAGQPPMKQTQDHRQRPCVQMAVMQPTPFCNLDCRYCYLPARSVRQLMSPATLAQSFRFLLAQPALVADPLVLAWHAGEPLAVPIGFYETAFELLQQLPQPARRIENWLQTNGTLINQDWCDFIKKWNLKIGVSVDGPEWLHNSNRVDRSGRGSLDKVLRGIDLLHRNHVEFATIGVLSKESLQFPEEIWRFYLGLGTKALAFTFEEIEGAHPTSSLHDESCLSQAEAFFERLLGLRNSEAPEIFIRELDELVEILPYADQRFTRMENTPLGIIGIAWNGDVSTYSPELIGATHTRYGDFVFANVHADTLESVMANPKFRMIRDEVAAGIEACRSACGYFAVCGGGQPSNKLYETGTFASSETWACRLRVQITANVVFRFLENQHGLVKQPGLPIADRIAALAATLTASARDPLTAQR